MEKLLISACLLGVNCKYNGKNNYNVVVSSDSGITRPITVEGDTAAGSTSSTAESIILASDFTKHYNYLHQFPSCIHY